MKNQFQTAFKTLLCAAILAAASVLAVAQESSSRLDRTVVDGPLAGRDYWLYESAPVRPLALSNDGRRLYVSNIPDGKLEIFAVTGIGITYLGSVPVGLEPVAVAVTADDKQVWVVNHLSDSISIVNVDTLSPYVERTLWVGDEPRDIVFAGPDFSRAFITTAHRGQNSPIDPELTTGGIGRADVWVFEAANTGAEPGGSPLSVITLFGDTPRALAASADGQQVYAAIFRSGNRTTTLPPAAIQSFPKPPPNDSLEGVTEPTTGIIVKSLNNIWQDELGRNYANVVTLALPDLDVFEIDAMAALPSETASFASVGTTLFNLAVNPINGSVYITNTDALNHVRFAGDSNRAGTSVRGHLADHRISVIKQGQVTTRDLNKHINYASKGNETDRNTSISQPMDMAITSDGSTMYVAAYGSSKIVRLDTAKLEADQHSPDTQNHIEVGGGGPTGLVLDEVNNRLFALTRFNNSISIIDLDSMQELEQVALFSPEPESVTQGRKFLYDARLTSGFGNEACSTCHLFGDNDAIAWDLGDPDGTVTTIKNAYEPLTEFEPRLGHTFHPLKGPMTTQSMRGLPRHGPQHWRGDRSGLDRKNGETLEEAAFKEFNEAFDALGAKSEPLSDADMQAFTDFSMQLAYPPNPIRNLDNSLTDSQKVGLGLYVNGVNRSDGILEVCITCHTTEPENGLFGTRGLMGFNDQPGEKDFKIPHFRDQYQKVGMFTSGADTPRPEIRGFALNHNGATSINNTFNEFGISRTLTNSIKDFLFAFPSESAPIMGQQVTMSKNSPESSFARYDLLVQRSNVSVPVPECDLIVQASLNGRTRGWSHDRESRNFVPDESSAAVMDEPEMAALIRQSEDAITVTCAPWGSGKRISIDRDGDDINDFDEILQGSDPQKNASSSFKASSGLWFNPSRAGSGFDLQHLGGSMAVTWFTYNEDNSPTWYQAAAPAGKNWQADLLRVEWDPQAGKAVYETVGQVSLAFENALNAVLDWQIGNKTGKETIERLEFSNQHTELPFTGLWYDPDEPGYGVTIDTQGDERGIVIYFYDNQNQPRWVLINQQNTLESTGNATSTTGPCPWCAFVPAIHTAGGTLSMNFSSRERALVDFRVFLSKASNGLWEREKVDLKRLTEEAQRAPLF